jgi:hypothetical protein
MFMFRHFGTSRNVAALSVAIVTVVALGLPGCGGGSGSNADGTNASQAFEKPAAATGTPPPVAPGDTKDLSPREKKGL